MIAYNKVYTAMLCTSVSHAGHQTNIGPSRSESEDFWHHAQLELDGENFKRLEDNRILSASVLMMSITDRRKWRFS